MSVSSAAYVAVCGMSSYYTFRRMPAVCKKNDAHGTVSVLCANVEVRHRIICRMSKNKCKIIVQNFNVNNCNNVIFNHITFLHT